MKLHCFVCATVVYPDDAEADRTLHSGYLHAQVAAFQKTGVQLTLIQNGCAYPSLGVPVIRNPIPKSLAYNYLLCDANCQGDYWVFLPEDCRVTAKGWEAIRKRDGRACFSLVKDPKCLIGRKGVFEGLSPEARATCELNFMGKEISHLLVRGHLDRQGLHCIAADWRQVSKEPPLWASECFEMIPGVHPNANLLRRMPTLDDYGISGYKAGAAKIEDVYGRIVRAALLRVEAEALACKSLISLYGPILTEIPYED